MVCTTASCTAVAAWAMAGVVARRSSRTRRAATTAMTSANGTEAVCKGWMDSGEGCLPAQVKRGRMSTGVALAQA